MHGNSYAFFCVFSIFSILDLSSYIGQWSEQLLQLQLPLEDLWKVLNNIYAAKETIAKVIIISMRTPSSYIIKFEMRYNK